MKTKHGQPTRVNKRHLCVLIWFGFYLALLNTLPLVQKPFSQFTRKVLHEFMVGPYIPPPLLPPTRRSNWRAIILSAVLSLRQSSSYRRGRPGTHRCRRERLSRGGGSGWSGACCGKACSLPHPSRPGNRSREGPRCLARPKRSCCWECKVF